MVTIDYRSPEPIYDQIVKGILRLKALGALSPGDKLPSVRSLAVDMGINPNTVQKAYAILESGGVIYSVPGKGSFLSGEEDAMELLRRTAREDLRREVRKALLSGLTAEELQQIMDEETKGGLSR